MLIINNYDWINIEKIILKYTINCEIKWNYVLYVFAYLKNYLIYSIYYDSSNKDYWI